LYDRDRLDNLVDGRTILAPVTPAHPPHCSTSRRCGQWPLEDAPNASPILRPLPGLPHRRPTPPWPQDPPGSQPGTSTTPLRRKPKNPRNGCGENYGTSREIRGASPRTNSLTLDTANPTDTPNWLWTPTNRHNPPGRTQQTRRTEKVLLDNIDCSMFKPMKGIKNYESKCAHNPVAITLARSLIMAFGFIMGSDAGWC